MARKRDERAAAEKAIADAVKAHKNADGLVTVYPVEGPDAGRMDGYPAVKQDVEPAVAVELVSARPPAFTLYESGNPLKEHSAIDEADMQQAWSATDLVDADVVIEEQPQSAPESAQVEV